ncbi:MAG: hypothetical protein ABI707_11820 [Ferruginibacter sp.]
MRTQLTSLLSQLRTEQLEILTTLVKETLVTEHSLPKSKTFTAADLWSIQRQGKSRIQRRFSF